MPTRSGLILAVAVCLALCWWLAHPHVRLPPPAPSTAAAPPACPLPPQVHPGDPPLQSPVPPGTVLPDVGPANLTALAGFSVDARVLAREDYRFGHEAAYSPSDLALGWGRMADPAILKHLSIHQSGRWYHYRWRGHPPIPPAEIARSSANMHIVPADERVAATLHRLHAGQHVRLDGWLVRIDDHGWHWASSLRRDDTGRGACELVYTCAITPL
ncbi:MAG: hypothetical protein ACOY4A_00510 [Pseudomonadota bacterium]